MCRTQTVDRRKQAAATKRLIEFIYDYHRFPDTEVVFCGRIIANRKYTIFVARQSIDPRRSLLFLYWLLLS